jgi:glycosyltransferase involved in cell wall biosynthesis
MTTDELPKVSVCVITYNQARYIGECLQSIVDQQTSFRFEILVADNGSQDGTTGIVEGFARRYPQLVRPILRGSKISGSANYVLVHDQACGQYVVHMDGDDRALPGKLQRQSDVLDQNPAALQFGIRSITSTTKAISALEARRHLGFKDGVVRLGSAIGWASSEF